MFTKVVSKRKLNYHYDKLQKLIYLLMLALFPTKCRLQSSESRSSNSSSWMLPSRLHSNRRGLSTMCLCKQPEKAADRSVAWRRTTVSIGIQGKQHFLDNSELWPQDGNNVNYVMKSVRSFMMDHCLRWNEIWNEKWLSQGEHCLPCLSWLNTTSTLCPNCFFFKCKDAIGGTTGHFADCHQRRRKSWCYHNPPI